MWKTILRRLLLMIPQVKIKTLKIITCGIINNNFTPFVIDDSASDYFKCLDFPVG